jgi:hypothetical protein
MAFRLLIYEPYSLVSAYQLFHIQVGRVPCSSERLEATYKTTRCHNLEDLNGNLKIRFSSLGWDEHPH